MGPPEYEIADFEYPPSDLPFVVPTEGLLVAGRANDGHLMGLFEQVNRVLLGVHGPVVVKGLDPWGAMVEVRGQYCLSSVGQEEGCEPYGSVQVVIRLQRVTGTSTTHHPAYLLSRSKMCGLSP